MNDTVQAVRKRTLRNVLYLIVFVAGAAGLGWLLGHGVDSLFASREASAGTPTVDVRLTANVLASLMAVVGGLIWMAIMLNDLFRNFHNKRFFYINLSLLLAPFLAFVIMMVLGL